MNASEPKNRIPLSVLLPASVTMLVIALTLIAATYAWQLSNHEAGNLDNTIVESDSVDPSILPYSLFIDVQTPILDENDEPTGEYNYSIEVFNDTTEAELNSYDAILGRNDHTSAYIRMPVYGVQAGDTMTFTVVCNGEMSEHGNNTGRITVGSTQTNVKLSQYISNIIRISCGNIPASVIPENADKDTIYTGAKTWFSENSAPSDTFVKYGVRPNPREPVILQRKDLEIALTLAPGNYTVEENGMIYVYFKIDYEYDLVDAYISALRLEQGGFKIGEEGHAIFTGEIENGGGYDLQRITMTVTNN